MKIRNGAIDRVEGHMRYAHANAINRSITNGLRYTRRLLILLR
jgi:hypothetical protein